MGFSIWSFSVAVAIYPYTQVKLEEWEKKGQWGWAISVGMATNDSDAQEWTQEWPGGLCHLNWVVAIGASNRYEFNVGPETGPNRQTVFLHMPFAV
jgi:hypothetical protein